MAHNSKGPFLACIAATFQVRYSSAPCFLSTGRRNRPFWHVFVSWQRKKRCRNHRMALEVSAWMVCASLSVTFKCPRGSHTPKPPVSGAGKCHCLTGKGSEWLGTILQSTITPTGLLWWLNERDKWSFWQSSRHTLRAFEILFHFYPLFGIQSQAEQRPSSWNILAAYNNFPVSILCTTFIIVIERITNEWITVFLIRDWELKEELKSYLKRWQLLRKTLILLFNSQWRIDKLTPGF